MTETMTLKREKALELLHRHVKNEKMIFHCLASEAVMRELAARLGRDEEKWAMAGLLHDLDVEITNADPLVHGTQTEVLLKDYRVDADILDAIRMHNECSAGKERETEFQYALAAGETITGLIFATTYVYPDRKLTSVKPKSVVKRMKEKIFAASVKRENILECEKIGIPIDEFAALAITAMLPIAGEIGL
jgi:putative nucleotidyltransferase with HDIG domain